MSTAIIIQARMGSTRFPGKVLAPLGGIPVIEHVLRRAAEVPEIDRIILATTRDRSDDPLATYVNQRCIAGTPVHVYRGATQNVLHRFYHAARAFGSPNTIVRLTADCPLVDPRVVSEVIGCGTDWYVGRTNSPDGTDVEVFSLRALEAAYLVAEHHQTEHVTTWMRENRLALVRDADPLFADAHYSVNTIEDLQLCEKILEICGEAASCADHVEAIRRMAT